MDHEKVFKSSTLMLLVPAMFLGAALFLRSNENLSILMWILLVIGVITTLAVMTSFTTLIITQEEIRIKNLKKSHVIQSNEIARKGRTISTSKGIESVVWKLYLKSGGVVTISSDLFKEKENLKEALDEFLRRIPKK